MQSSLLTWGAINYFYKSQFCIFRKFTQQSTLKNKPNPRAFKLGISLRLRIQFRVISEAQFRTG